MRVYQIIVTIIKGDAIGNYARMINKILRKSGLTTAIYAENIGAGLEKENIYHINLLENVKEDDVILYHMCERTAIHKLIKKLKCVKIAIYHNVTPPYFFSWLDRKQEWIQKESLREICSLKNEFNYCIADSEFNKKNLVEMGYRKEKIKVFPVMIDFTDYEKYPDTKILEKYKDDWINIVFVGRIAPNKKQEDLIKCFAYYKKKVNKKSRLILVGSAFSKDYLSCLNDYICLLDAEDVIVTGHVTFKEILAYYRTADIFLCMSEHEGFCVPLIEAMLFHIPIVAFKSTAIPYTLGGSGILIDVKDPILVSAILSRIVSDEKLKNSIINRQDQRVNDFRIEKLQREFKEMLLEIVGGIQ